VVHTVLKDSNLKSISCEEARKLASQGWRLVDVRLAGDFDRGHAEGAESVPLYRFVEGRVRGAAPGFGGFGAVWGARGGALSGLLVGLG
jgi:hypothetical protein